MTHAFMLIAVIALPWETLQQSLHTKRYRCVQVDESSEDSMQIAGADDFGHKSTMADNYGKTTINEAPSAKRPHPAATSFISPMEVPHNSQGLPLILSPQHCEQVKMYASMYGVRDVVSWVKSNCAFARMYLPNATCEEINVLIGSCYERHAEWNAPTKVLTPKLRRLRKRLY